MNHKKKLLSEDKKKSLFKNYHSYISSTIKTKSKLQWHDFYDYLRENDPFFIEFDDKQINNKIIDFRKIHGNTIWPSFAAANKLYICLPDEQLDKLYDGDTDILKQIKSDENPFMELVESIHRDIYGSDNIKGIINNFLLRIRDIELSLKEIIPASRKIEEANIKKKDEVIREISRREVQLTLGEDEYKVSVGDLYDFVKSIEQLNHQIRSNHSEVIIKSLFLNIFSVFDAFIGELLLFIFKNKPELLSNKTKQINFCDILNFGDKDEIIENFIIDEIDALRRESYHTQFSQMERIFNIKLSKFEYWSDFIEMAQRRNIIMHCDGRISEQYIKVCKEHGCQPENNIGDNIHIEYEYLEKSINIIKLLIFLLGQTLWRSKFPDQIDIANDYNISLSYDMLLCQDWTFAKNIADYGINIPSLQIKNDAYRKVLIINKCIAFKESDEFNKARQALDAEDFSSCSIDFKLAKETLLNNNDKAYEYLRRIGKEGEFVNEKSYLVWPLFNHLRFEPEFANVYKEIYKKDFLEQIEIGVTGIVNSQE